MFSTYDFVLFDQGITLKPKAENLCQEMSTEELLDNVYLVDVFVNSRSNGIRGGAADWLTDFVKMYADHIRNSKID